MLLVIFCFCVSYDLYILSLATAYWTLNLGCVHKCLLWLPPRDQRSADPPTGKGPDLSCPHHSQEEEEESRLTEEVECGEQPAIDVRNGQGSTTQQCLLEESEARRIGAQHPDRPGESTRGCSRPGAAASNNNVSDRPMATTMMTATTSATTQTDTVLT